MRASERVAAMRMTRRKLAGQIVRAEYQRRGWKAKDAHEHVGIAPATLYRLYDGDPNIQDFTLTAVEGGLDLPSGLLSYIIEGNISRIEALTMRADLQDRVLYELRTQAYALGDQEIGNDDS